MFYSIPHRPHCSDARLWQHADGKKTVHGAGVTTREGASAVCQRFLDDGIPVLGTILNDWTPQAGHDYGFYPYKEYAADGRSGPVRFWTFHLTVSRARVAFATAVSWCSRLVAILSGLVLIPVLFRHLGNEELGVWLLLGQSWSVLGILDFGFAPTVARWIALAKGTSGGEVDVVLREDSRREIADLVTSASRVFGLLAVFVFGVAWLMGYLYLSRMEFHTLTWQTALLAWTVLCVSQAVSVWAMIWPTMLFGLGYVGWDLILESSLSLLTIAVQIGVSLAGGGLMGLAIVQAASAITSRILFITLIRRYAPDVYYLRGQWNPAIIKRMVRPALHCWLTTLGGVLIMQTDQFFVVQAKGAAQLPSYRAAYLLCINVQMIAISVARTSAPFISQLWSAGKTVQAQRLTRQGLFFGLGAMFTGIAVIFAGGEDLFRIWLGPGHFAGYALLAAFSLVMLLETHSFIVSTSSRATEDEAFATWGITAGVLKVVLSMLLVKPFGLIGIPAGTLVAQGLTNYWYMVYRGLKRLGIPFREHFRSVLIPMSLAFGLAILLAFVARRELANSAPVVRLGGVVASGSLVFLLICWLFVFDASNAKGFRASLRW